MNLTALFLIFIIIWTRHVSKCFYGDQKPKLILDFEATANLPVFIGAGPNSDEASLLDVQEIKLFNDKVVIGSRNEVYVVSRNSFKQKTGSIPYDQIITWNPSPTNGTTCYERLGSNQTCQNYIRLMSLVAPDTVLLCGTNSAAPQCREYEWTDSKFAEKRQEINGMYKIPFDDVSSLAYLQSGGNIFSATRKKYHWSYPTITRTAATDANLPSSRSNVRGRGVVVDSNQPLGMLTTETDKVWLNNPYFAGMVDTPEKVFIFFREEAIDASDPTETVIHSRVAQVCKDDNGGNIDILRHKWTSFFKARLNCSFPGNRPFYFNEIQHITEPQLFNGYLTVFATMTTPKNSIPGSALCAFTLNDIEKAMDGSFKEQNPSSHCWKEKIRNYPTPSPTKCRPRNAKELEKSTLEFIKVHPFMSDAVDSVDGIPLFSFTQTTDRFTAVAVETNISGVHDSNATMFYIGTQHGKLLKVVSGQVDGKQKVIFSEEWNIFKAAECSARSAAIKSARYADTIDASNKDEVEAKEKYVRDVTLISYSDVILVTYQHCVISVPKQMCWNYKCESACIQSGNPYCGWMDGYCVLVTKKNSGKVQQDLFSETTLSGNCLTDGTEGKSTPNQSVEQCSDLSATIVPLVLGLIGTFIVVLFLFFLIMKCRKKYEICMCMGKKSETTGKENKHNTQSGGPRFKFFSHSRNVNVPRVSIEATSPIEPSIRSRRHHDENIPLNNTNNSNLNSHDRDDVIIVRNVALDDNLSGEDTTWSDGLFESDLSVPDLHLAEQALTADCPQSGEADELQPCFNSNNNKVVGIAHPMFKKCTKLSQVVKPTFVSNSFSKVTTGFNVQPGENYGATSFTETGANINANDGNKFSRIMSNPNYLPVTPFLSRSSNENVESKIRQPPTCVETSQNSSSLSTFSPVNEFRHENENNETFGDSSNDLLFPPPPSCVVSPASTDRPKLLSFTTLPVSSSWYPSPPQNATYSSTSTSNERTSLTSCSTSRSKSSTDGNEPISSSASGESTSSGFVSSSPKTSFKDQSTANRKALIVAKGMISAQTFLATPNSKRAKKKRQSNQGSKRNVSEGINDDVFDGEAESESASEKVSSSKYSERASCCLEDVCEIAYRSPEFCCSSDDDDDENLDSLPPSPTDPLNAVQGEDSKRGRSKKSISIFRSKKNRKSKRSVSGKVQALNEDTFMSPAYDEEPIVPVVEGWEEIDYSSGVFDPHKFPSDVSSSLKTGRSYDDSYICVHGRSREVDKRSGTLDFHTMRPKSRMRQKLPKMRNTSKKWALANNPLPVPTPAVPDA